MKNARALFSQYNQLSLTATLPREQGSILREVLGDDVPAVESHTVPPIQCLHG